MGAAPEPKMRGLSRSKSSISIRYGGGSGISITESYHITAEGGNPGCGAVT